MLNKFSVGERGIPGCSEISRTDILRGTNRIFCRVLPVDSPYLTPLLMYNDTISIFQNITLTDGDAGY
jgi:hypothetical protein